MFEQRSIANKQRFEHSFSQTAQRNLLTWIARLACTMSCLVLIATATIFVMPAAVLADTVAADSIDSATELTTDAAHLANGSQVFQAHCEGCHINGGNIIRRGKTLKLKALQRNSMDSLEAIAQIVTNGKNNMSAFGDRLTEQQIQDVAAYVLTQAETDWKKQ